MNSDIKVCMMTYAMPPEHSGAARQALSLAHALAENGVKVFFLTQGNRRENISLNDVQGFRVYRVYKETLFWKILAPFRFFYVLYRERHNFDIIHVHGVGYLAKIAVLFGLLLGRKVILKMTMYGEDDALSIKHGKNGALNFLFFSLASRYISLTKSFLDSCIKAGIPREKVELVPNGVNTAKFFPVSDSEKANLRAKLGIPCDKTVLAYAGIIRPEKGIDFLLDVISNLSDFGVNAVLVLLGPVEKWLPKNELIKVEATLGNIRALSQKGLVIYPGRVEHVEDYFKAADVFVSASYREGLQNVLLESMACGLPPVVVAIPNVHENIISDGGDGLVLKERDVLKFSETVRQLLDNSDLKKRLASAALRKIIDVYSLDKVAAEYCRIYAQL